MKKVGIMTWFEGNNYGTVLQAVALQHSIEQLGYDTYIINYKKRTNNREIKSFDKLKKRIIRKVTADQINNIEFFDIFRNKYLKISSSANTYIELKELNEVYDAFVCGSDQVWSPLSFDEKYFLNFANNNKIISYAPSFGVSEITNSTIKKEMKSLISRFVFLSVREIQGKKIIEELANKDAKVVLDPTLLLSFDEWSYFESNDITKKLNGEYILCYFLDNSNKYYKRIKRFARNKKLKIINIPTLKRQYLNKFNINGIGPSEFLSLFKNAKFVLTDSFHGTVFSINYNKDFMTFKRFKDNDERSENSRLESILKIFNLKNHFISINEFKDIIKIDYDIINNILFEKKEESKKFLKYSLDKINCVKLTEEKYVITDYCSGCGVCRIACPKKAVEIKKDEYGFEHSFINKSKCINCGLCKRVCPMLKIKSSKIENMLSLYSYKSKEKYILQSSSSGGISYAIAKLLNGDYYVCGSYYDNLSECAKHILILPNNSSELYKIQGSKYIQSITTEALDDILNLTKNDKVVFFGTPCQVSGIDRLLRMKNKRSNFVLVELICHGVPTIYLWKSYLNTMLKKHNIDSKCNVVFRDKKRGWHQKYIKLYDDLNEVVISETKDDFYNIFNGRYVCNNSCYECPYREYSSADLKIGDFWGQKYKKDEDGVSMVIVMTPTGQDIINKLSSSSNAFIHEENIYDYFKYQNINNESKPIYREEMIKEIKENKNLKKIRKKYCKYDEFVRKIIPIVKLIKRSK